MSVSVVQRREIAGSLPEITSAATVGTFGAPFKRRVSLSASTAFSVSLCTVTGHASTLEGVTNCCWAAQEETRGCKSPYFLSFLNSCFLSFALTIRFRAIFGSRDRAWHRLHNTYLTRSEKTHSRCARCSQKALEVPLGPAGGPKGGGPD